MAAPGHPACSPTCACSSYNIHATYMQQQCHCTCHMPRARARAHACPRARACAQVLISLLSSAPSHEDAQALKGFACLRELRRAAVQEEEPAAFNACLRRLKEQYMGGGAGAGASRTPFWAAIVNDAGLQPGLITADETEESEVSAAEAADRSREPLCALCLLPVRQVSFRAALRVRVTLARSHSGFVCF